LANEFGLSEFVVCTDAGLSGLDNRIYNTTEGRNYIVTQSIPMLPERLRSRALEKKGWRRLGDRTDTLYDISEINLEQEKGSLFYRDRWHIEDRGPVANYEHRTSDGEIADRVSMAVDAGIITKEAQYDGLNCLATKLDGSIGEILNVNGFRYKVEHLFRITKTEFDARPVYLQREDRIKAHLAICFVALLIIKAYQKQINENRPDTDKYSTEQIINALSGMDYLYVRGYGYIPAHSATNLRNHCCSVSNIT